MRKFVVVMVALMALVAAPVLAQDEPGTIADIVIASAGAETPEFSVLLAAVQAADPAIVEALSDAEQELTVFAPTDAAFTALLEALEVSAEDLLADTETLNEVLLFHVVPGTYMSAAVVDHFGMSEDALQLQTLQGQYLDITQGMDDMEEPAFYVDGAMLNLEMVDIEASNGVIHVIDAVILPESRNLAEIVIDAAGAETPEFSTLLAAVQAADPAVLEALTDPEAELTVFAPTDAAFAAAFEALGIAPEDLLADTETLTGILLYHVLEGTVGSNDVVALLEENMGEFTVTMLSGDDATVAEADMGIQIAGANIVMTNIDAANGIIHVIDAVILPAAEE